MSSKAAAIKTQPAHNFWANVEPIGNSTYRAEYGATAMPIYFALNQVGTYDVTSAAGRYFGRLVLIDDGMGGAYLVCIKAETGWIMATSTNTLGYALVCLIDPDLA